RARAAAQGRADRGREDRASRHRRRRRAHRERPAQPHDYTPPRGDAVVAHRECWGGPVLPADARRTRVLRGGARRSPPRPPGTEAAAAARAGAREEVLVQAAGPGTYQLRTAGFDTGPQGNRYPGAV